MEKNTSIEGCKLRGPWGQQPNRRKREFYCVSRCMYNTRICEGRKTHWNVAPQKLEWIKHTNFLVNGSSDASNIGHKAVSHTLDTSSNSLTQQHIRLVGFLLISLPHHFTRIERTGTVKGCASCKYLKHLTRTQEKSRFNDLLWCSNLWE